MKADGTLYQRFGKKEALGMERELEKLERSLGGIKDMKGVLTYFRTGCRL